ncbi:BAR/IMD domain-containing adapter protein 2-like 2 [Aulostomus maculatus]
MSAMNSDQLYRSTLEIYSNLMDEFNPSLQKLVSLGNSYVQAFHALAVTSEAYFTALSKIGEKAFHTMSSHSIGDILIQISESQRRLTLELEGVFRCFTVDVLQEMDNNIRLDKDYIAGSRKHYEIRVHDQAAALERQLRQGAHQDGREYVQFLRESHSEALKEEERRYRFLAEKHCSLLQSISSLMNKSGIPLQQRAEYWRDEVNATRGLDPGTPATLDSTTQVRRSREDLSKIPSRAPSPQGSIRSRAESFGGGGRSARARVAHQPGDSNPTLLPFNRGEMITVLVQQPKNGWLYGRTDSNSRQGWFPSSYVEEVGDLSRSPDSGSTLRRNTSNHSLGGGQAPPPPPLPSSNKHLEMNYATHTGDRRAESNQESKHSQPHGSRPELFPRGTNPFATVKLKPTSTNDRSGPRLHR